MIAKKATRGVSDYDVSSLAGHSYIRLAKIFRDFEKTGTTAGNKYFDFCYLFPARTYKAYQSL